MKRYIAILTITACIFTLCFYGLQTINDSPSNEANAAQHEAQDEHDQDGPDHTEEHDEHEKELGEEHEGHDDEEGLKFDHETLDEFQIKTDTARPGKISKTIETPGEIVPNPDLVSHIVPRVSGVVREVKFSLGDSVKEGDILAVLESRELASLKSNYLSAIERLKLSQEIFDREQQLWEKKISAEQEYLKAKQKLAEAKISVNAAEQQLHAIGFSQAYVDQLTQQTHALITRYEIRAPFSGLITEKHITLGEYVKDEDSIFTISDLSQVWAHITLYQKNIPDVRLGQKATVSFKLGDQQTTGTISFISPMLDLHTRTGTARVVLDNTEGNWRPGMFINASIVTDEIPVPIYVPKSAVFTIENRPSVFVKAEDGFEPVQVKVGRKNHIGYEILDGLHQGQVYVSQGGFTLKAELDKDAFADGGHAH